MTTVTHFQLFSHSFNEAFSQSIINAVLNIDTVCTYTSLTTVTVFTCHDALNRLIQVCVIKNQDRCVTAQFKRKFLDGWCTLLHQDTTHLG